MKLASVQITNFDGRLAARRNPTILEMKQPMADMTIRQPQAEIEYYQKDAKLLIDQSEAFADAGLKPVSRMIQEYAEKGKQQVLKAMATTAKQGDQLMNIAKESGTIQRLAKENSESPIRDFNIGFVPSSTSKVKKTYIPGELHVKIEQRTPEVKIKANQPIIKVNPGDLEIYLKQKPTLSFKTVGLNVDYQK